MKLFYDVYVLCEDRSPNPFEKFKSSFLIDAEESAGEYAYPRFAEKPEFRTKDVLVILERLFAEKEEEYAIYWHVDLADGIMSAMMFFTDDGYVIYGLTVDENKAENMLGILKKVFSTKIGYITFEQPPPLNSKDFIKTFNNYDEI